MPPVITSIKKWIRICVPEKLLRWYRQRKLKRIHGLVDIGPVSECVVLDTTFGRKCRINGRVMLRHVTIGDYSYVEAGARITNARIGKFCSISPSVMVGLAAHPVGDYVSTHPAFYLYSPSIGYDLADRDYRDEYATVEIGNDVWIGAGAYVKDGIRIGDGSIIGAGAVVTRDVPPYAIVGGVPARLIRYRFDEDTIRFLLELRWWDRDDSWLRKHLRDMQSVDAFRNNHQSRQVIAHHDRA